MNQSERSLLMSGAQQPTAGFGAERRASQFPEFSAAFALVTIYSYATSYILAVGYEAFKPLYFYIALYLCGLFCCVSYSSSRVMLSRNWQLLQLWALLLAIIASQFLFMRIGPEGVDLFIQRIHFGLTLVAAFSILGACTRFSFVVTVLKWVVVCSCIINVSEFFLAGTYFEWMSTVPGRAAGAYQDPNDSAMFISFAIPLIALNSSARSRWLFYLVTFVGVYLTFSRGGLISWAVFAALAELASGYGSRGWGQRALIAATGLITVVGLVAYFSSDLSEVATQSLWPYLDSNTSSRVEFLSRDSTDERMFVLQRGLQAFADAPIFGQGIGYTFSWDVRVSVHNMFVLFLAELGLIGAAWFAAFLATLWSYGRPYGTIIAIMFMITSFFNHTSFERPAVAILIAIYLVAACRTSMFAPSTSQR